MTNSDHKYRNNLHTHGEHVTESNKHLAVSVYFVRSGNKAEARKTNATQSHHCSALTAG